MKKYILSIVIILAANFAIGQTSYQARFANANRDSIRTQIRMAVIDIATERIDTATNATRRLCIDVLGQPTASFWVDYFAYQIVVMINTATPTDNMVRNNILLIWDRVALINTRR